MAHIDKHHEQAWQEGVLIFGLFLLALIPRTVSIGSFQTVDESVHWFQRAYDFLQAIRSGDYIHTYQVGHPGVTTMWLGAFGTILSESFHITNPVSTMHVLRLPVAVVNALVIAIACIPLRRLVGTGVALLSVMLWATDPFLVAHGQLLHVDALLTSFMTLSLLFGMLAFRWDSADDGIAWGALFASALLGGLALLTKSLALLLPIEIGALALLALRHPGLSHWRVILGALVIWGLITIVVWVMLWPAVWVDALGVIQRIIDEVRTNGGEPHGSGNFLLGRSVTDPGPLFYPLAFDFRLTPWAMLGLILAPAWLHAHTTTRKQAQILAFLAACVLLVLALLSVMAKKFDRYMLPAFPLVEIIAASGLIWLGQMSARGLGAISRRWQQAYQFGRTRGMVGVLTAVLLTMNLAHYHPYELAYYNPLLGGGSVAQHVIPVGWGEGIDLALAYIRQQPDGCTLPTAIWYGSLAKGLGCGSTVHMGNLDLDRFAGYAILYIDQIQRGYYADITQAFETHEPFVKSIEYAGITYAKIYRIPSANEHALNASFGTNLRLLSYQIDTSNPEYIRVILRWQEENPLPENMFLFLHVLAADGQRVIDINVPLRATFTTSGPWQPSQIVIGQQDIPVPAQLAHGSYWVALGIYEPDDDLRLALNAPAPPRGVPQSGSDALTIGPFTH